MARQKKTLSLHSQENKSEVEMSESAVLENLQQEIDQARLELEKTKKEIEEKKAELKSSPKRDLDKDEKILVEKQIARTNIKSSLQKKIEDQKKIDNEMITGRFLNQRAPGQPAKLTYMRYNDDPVKWYHFEHNKVYTIPRGFVDEINEYYNTPTFTKKEGPMNPDSPSSQIHSVDTSNKKYAFVPLNF